MENNWKEEKGESYRGKRNGEEKINNANTHTYIQ